MEATERPGAHAPRKLTYNVHTASQAARIRATSAGWAAVEYFGDFRLVAAVRLRAAAFKLRSAVARVRPGAMKQRRPAAGAVMSAREKLESLLRRARFSFDHTLPQEQMTRFMRTVAAGTLAALVLTFAPVSAAFQLAVYGGSADAVLPGSISEPVDIAADPEEIRAEVPAAASELLYIQSDPPPLAEAVGAGNKAEDDNGTLSFSWTDDVYGKDARIRSRRAAHAPDGWADIEEMVEDDFDEALDVAAGLAADAGDTPADGTPVWENQEQESRAEAKPTMLQNTDTAAVYKVDDAAVAAVAPGEASPAPEETAGGASASESGADVAGFMAFPVVRTPIASAAGYVWPADGNLTSGFGYRSATVGSKNHKGIDICAKYDDPIFAAGSGEVVASGWNGAFGYVIEILHDNGHRTLYAHCSSLLLNVGDTVEQGQKIALMGSTGNATAIHVHFELIINGENVDPVPYLP